MTISEQVTIRERGKDTRFKKGKSGNPGGRPKDPGITASQIKMLDKVCPYSKSGQTWREYLAERGLVLATEQARAMEDLKDRIEGKVINPLVASGEVTILVKYDR